MADPFHPGMSTSDPFHQSSQAASNAAMAQQLAALQAKQNSSGGFLHFLTHNPVTDTLGNLTGDLVNMGEGLGPGIFHLFEHPIGSAESIGRSYKQAYYDPFEKGGFGGLLHAMQQHPLGYLLDATALFDFGASLGVKGLEIAGKTGDEAGILGKIHSAANTPMEVRSPSARMEGLSVPEAGAQERTKLFGVDQRPGVALRQKALYGGLSNIPKIGDKLGGAVEDTRYMRSLLNDQTRNTARRIIGKDNSFSDFIKANGKMTNQHERRATAFHVMGVSPADYVAGLHKTLPEAQDNFLRTYGQKSIREGITDSGSGKLIHAPASEDMQAPLRAAMLGAEHPESRMLSAEGLVHNLKGTPEDLALVKTIAAKMHSEFSLPKEEIKANMHPEVQRLYDNPNPRMLAMRNLTHSAIEQDKLNRTEVTKKAMDPRDMAVRAHAPQGITHSGWNMFPEQRMHRINGDLLAEAGQVDSKTHMVPTHNVLENKKGPDVHASRLSKPLSPKDSLRELQASGKHLDALRNGEFPGVTFRLQHPNIRMDPEAMIEHNKALMGDKYHEPLYLPHQMIEDRPVNYSRSHYTLYHLGHLMVDPGVMGNSFVHGIRLAHAMDIHDALSKQASVFDRAEMALMQRKSKGAWMEIHPSGAKTDAARHEEMVQAFMHDHGQSVANMNPADHEEFIHHLIGAREGVNADKVHMVPRKMYEQAVNQYKSQMTGLGKVLNGSTKLWKQIILGYSPRFVANQNVGNLILGSLHMMNPADRARAMFNLISSTKGHAAAEGLVKSLEHDPRVRMSDPVVGEFFGGKDGAREGLHLKSQHLEQGVFVKKEGMVDLPGSHRIRQGIREGVFPLNIRIENALRRNFARQIILSDKKFTSILHGEAHGDLRLATRLAKKDATWTDHIARQLDDIMGNYRTAAGMEHGIRRFIPFYQWDKHAVRAFSTFAFRHPIAANVVRNQANLGLEDIRKRYGNVPEFLNNYVPIPGLDKGHGNIVKALNTNSMNPLRTIADEVKIARSLVSGKATDAAPVVGGILNPFMQSAIEDMTGHTLLSGAPVKNGVQNHGLLTAVISQVAESLPEGQILAGMLKGTQKPGLHDLYTPTGQLKKPTQHMLNHSPEQVLLNLLGFGERDVNIKQAQADQARTDSQNNTGFHVAKQRTRKNKMFPGMLSSKFPS